MGRMEVLSITSVVENVSVMVFRGGVSTPLSPKLKPVVDEAKTADCKKKEFVILYFYSSILDYHDSVVLQ